MSFTSQSLGRDVNGIITVTAAAQRDALEPYNGMLINRLDTGVLERYDGMRWQLLIPETRTSPGWTDFNPRWTSGGFLIIPGTGGAIVARYSMIAPYTMSLHISVQWGSALGNGGSGAAHTFTLPTGYATANIGTQLLQTQTGQPGLGNGMGFGYVTANQSNIRPYGYTAGSNGVIVPWGTATGTGPSGWYPSGNGVVQGTLEVAQEW